MVRLVRTTCRGTGPQQVVPDHEFRSAGKCTALRQTERRKRSQPVQPDRGRGIHAQYIAATRAVAPLFLIFAATLPASAQERAPGPLTLQAQGSFFIGGCGLQSYTLSALPAFALSGTMTVGQCITRSPPAPESTSLSP
jgi:hypothetical protein